MDFAAEYCHHPSQRIRFVKPERKAAQVNEATIMGAPHWAGSGFDAVSTGLLDFRLLVELLLFIQEFRGAHAI
jgi:hypothetical protein